MNDFHILHDRMIERLRERYEIQSERVLDAMRQVSRHHFVPQAIEFRAYEDGALPISGKQTISQPYIVAKMTELLELTSTSRVLEIGSGSGYQTVILSRLAGRVFSIERIADLAEQAKKMLRQYKARNVTLRCDDGTRGWEIYSPYDAILVAAGAPEIPQPLLDQLSPGGKLVIPIGADSKNQNLIRVTRAETGFETEDFGACSFVPLIGKHGWSS